MFKKGGIQMGFLNKLFNKSTENAETSVFTSGTIRSPFTGQVLPLSDVSDPVFAQELMGKGIAFEPTDGEVLSPINGTVVMLFDTYHAIGLKSDEGIEILIHVGMDTVELKGKGFAPCVKTGDRVSIGDCLIEVDLAFVQETGYSIITPMVITNTNEYTTIEPMTVGHVTAGDDVLVVSK